MKRLEGRVAIVTGAGRGLGRAHALYLARQGAAVVANDFGGTVHGEGVNPEPAADIVAEIVADGGRAAASSHDVADWEAARDLIALAVEHFGTLDILVNNAGILRDRLLANMTEAEWDAVIRVHLKGHAATTRHAMSYWRDRTKAGHTNQASVIHTTSIGAFAGNFGQANYSAAKAAVLGLSRVVAIEGAKYGVRSNAVSPSARTRITLETPGAEEEYRAPDDPQAFDEMDPGNVSPLVGWLAERDCVANSQVFHTYGNRLIIVSMPSIVHDLRVNGRWTPADLDRLVPDRLLSPPSLDDFFSLEVN